MEKERAWLIDRIVETTGWGAVSGWQGGDFRRLSQLIFDKTRVNISESTLRRLLGKANYPHLPSETTLNTLAIFVGFRDWRDFKTQMPPQLKKNIINRRKIALIIAGVLLIALTGFLYSFYRKAVPHFDYRFSSRPVTRGIPNSVIFNYNVGKQASPVYIQQSWDSRTRVKVAPDAHTYASVYYRPGFFEAKLLVGNKIVKEHPLVIPTDGWLGIIYRQPVPVYLKTPEFTASGQLEIPPAAITAHGLSIEPDPPRAELYNVGNFRPVPVDSAGFSAMLKSDDNSASGVCRRVIAFLITNGVPISIVACNKGCIAAIGIFNGRTSVSGKTNDLSGFGAATNSWVKATVKTSSGKLQLLVNDHIAYECPLPPPNLKILGIAFGFEGGGAVKAISLSKNGRVIFKAY